MSWLRPFVGENSPSNLTSNNSKYPGLWQFNSIKNGYLFFFLAIRTLDTEQQSVSSYKKCLYHVLNNLSQANVSLSSVFVVKTSSQ